MEKEILDLDLIFNDVYSVLRVIVLTVGICFNFYLTYTNFWIIGFVLFFYLFHQLNNQTILAFTIKKRNFEILLTKVSEIKENISITCGEEVALVGTATSNYQVGDYIYLIKAKNTPLVVYKEEEFMLEESLKPLLSKTF